MAGEFAHPTELESLREADLIDPSAALGMTVGLFGMTEGEGIELEYFVLLCA